MVIQTLKENSVNYKYYTANSTLVQENLTDIKKILAKRWQEQVSIGQLGETWSEWPQSKEFKCQRWKLIER